MDTVTEISVNISTNIVFDDGYTWDNTRLQVENQIQEYLLDLRKTWVNQNVLTVRITQIETRILSVQGIVDIANTVINEMTDNLVLTGYEIPVFGGILI